MEPSAPAPRPARINPAAQALDFALLKAARDGDNRAFAALIDRHAPGLLRVAYSLSRNRADAEDVVQETFLAAYRGPVTRNTPRSLSSAVASSIVRGSIDSIRTG